MKTLMLFKGLHYTYKLIEGFNFGADYVILKKSRGSLRYEVVFKSYTFAFAYVEFTRLVRELLK